MIKSTIQVIEILGIGWKQSGEKKGSDRNQLGKGNRLDKMNMDREVCCKVPQLGLNRVLTELLGLP